MKKGNRTFLFVVLLFCSCVAFSTQSVGGATLWFEGELINTPHGTLQDGVYSMRFAILTSTGASRIWPVIAQYEEHSLVLVMGGRFNVELGSSGQPITNDVSQADNPQVQVWVCQPAGFECEGFEPLPIRLPLYTYSDMSLETPLPPESENEDQAEEQEDWEIVELPEGSISEAWMLAGNTGTNPALDFLGTTDNTPLHIRAAGLTALRIEPTATSPNLIGGFHLNSVAEGVYGATISGGGLALGQGSNIIVSIFGTIGGGARNQVNGEYGTVAGGENGLAGSYAFAGGGKANLALGSHSTIGGGYANRTSGSWATTGGGIENWATGQVSFIGGGYFNRATGEYSAIAGGDLNTAGGDRAAVAGGSSNQASGDYSFIGGGIGNRAMGTSAFASGSNNQAGGYFSFVAGGVRNSASGNSAFATGSSNYARGDFSFVAGGSQNEAAGDHSFVGGKTASTTSDADGSFVWAGEHDEVFESWRNNEFLVRATSGMFVNAGMNAAQSARNTNTAGLRVEVGRTDLDGTRSQMEDIAGRPGNWSLSSNPGLDLQSVAIAGLALERSGLRNGEIALGVWGQSVGRGVGVLGESKGPDEESIGVMGASLNSHGIFGETYSSEEGRAGGYFRAYSNTGRTYGVLGQAKSPDGYGVYSDGNAHVEGELTWKSKMSYISISPIDFMGADAAPGWIGNDRSWGPTSIAPKSTCGFRDATEEEMLFMALHLPHGARLDYLSFYYDEAGGDANSRLILGKADFSGNVVLLADIVTAGSYVSSRQDDCGNHIVDNSTGSYYLFMALDCQTTFYGASISYEISEPY